MPLFLPSLSESGPEMRSIGRVRPVSVAATQEINLKVKVEMKVKVNQWKCRLVLSTAWL